jgi:hypothetical protein
MTSLLFGLRESFKPDGTGSRRPFQQYTKPASLPTHQQESAELIVMGRIGLIAVPCPEPLELHRVTRWLGWRGQVTAQEAERNP